MTLASMKANATVAMPTDIGAVKANATVAKPTDIGAGKQEREMSQKQKAIELIMDFGAPFAFFGAVALLAFDIHDYPACDSGTVIGGPDSDGYYGRCRLTSSDDPDL